MAVISMNTGNAMASVILAIQQGKFQSLPAAARWLGAYVPKAYGARVYVDPILGMDVVQQGQGAAVAPYKTLAYAVAAMGKVKTQAGFEQERTLEVVGNPVAGFHDVSALVLPMGRWIVNLSEGAKLQGTMKMNLTAAEAFTSSKLPSLTMNNVDSYPGNVSVDEVEFVQDGTTLVASALFTARGILFDTLVTGPATLTSLGVELDRCAIGEVTMVGASVVSFRCVWARDVSVKNIAANGDQFSGDITTTAGSNFVSTVWVGTNNFAGVAGGFKVDGMSNYYWKTTAGTLSGGATKVITSDNTA